MREKWQTASYSSDVEVLVRSFRKPSRLRRYWHRMRLRGVSMAVIAAQLGVREKNAIAWANSDARPAHRTYSENSERGPD